jgi:hypothetical protein
VNTESTGVFLAPMQSQAEMDRLRRDLDHYKQRAHVAEAALAKIARTSDGRELIRVAHAKRKGQVRRWLSSLLRKGESR